jgi:hypothetical protein
MSFSFGRTDVVDLFAESFAETNNFYQGAYI